MLTRLLTRLQEYEIDFLITQMPLLPKHTFSLFKWQTLFLIFQERFQLRQTILERLNIIDKNRYFGQLWGQRGISSNGDVLERFDIELEDVFYLLFDEFGLFLMRKILDRLVSVFHGAVEFLLF